MGFFDDDITFCNGIKKIKLNELLEHRIECPLSSKCHRHIDIPKGHPWLSVFVDAPFIDDKCEFFWLINRKEKTDNRKINYKKFNKK